MGLVWSCDEVKVYGVWCSVVLMCGGGFWWWISGGELRVVG